jgi:hypothetical protein
VKLTADELDAALGFLEARGASFAFPQPLELQSIRYSWDKVRPALQSVELLSYTPHPCVKMTAPKQRCLVRPVHLIDPIDVLLYTGLAFRIAPAIEKKRQECQVGRVFSYHFNPADLGTKDSLKSDWNGHIERLEELCDQFNYVGVTDIVDFFPRVYLHRLQNGLDSLVNDSLAIRALMRLINGWAVGTSYGIPTGPHVSNFLAEALLIEVDEFLMSGDVRFVRWVDDYFIFGESEQEVVSGMFRLGERLDQTQGLSLNSAKTRLQTCENYLEFTLHRVDPVEEWRQETIEEVLGAWSWYDEIDIDDLTEEQLEAMDAVDARNILEGALEADIVDLRTVQLILVFLSTFQRPDLAEMVLDNLPLLSPLGESVARFLNALDEILDADHVGIGKRVLDYVTGDGFVPEYQAMWLLDPFTRSSSWGNLSDLRKLARDARSPLVRRQAILGLRQVGDRSALLDAKSCLDDARDWEERSILFACARLPQDERDAVIAQVGGAGGQWTAGNCLKKAVLAFMKLDAGA